MPDRFRAFLDRPLDPRAARAVLVLALASFVGFAAVALVGLGTEDGRGSSTSAATPAPSSTPPAGGSNGRSRATVPRQDPQDRLGTAAAQAARGELRSHRALQHVPYRDDGVLIDLVGARHGRALLLVRGGDLTAARRGWQRFLDRYDDEGADYRPIFHSGGRDG